MTTRLADSIEQAKLAEWAVHGRCTLCRYGVPLVRGGHIVRNPDHAERCGNLDACTLCAGCLPPGEICKACYRKNVYDIKC